MVYGAAQQHCPATEGYLWRVIDSYFLAETIPWLFSFRHGTRGILFMKSA
jgi:hypothetical protein